MSSSGKKRLFTGIALPEEMAEEFMAFQQKNDHTDKIRWVTKETMHITTCFIGDQPEEETESYIQKAEEVLKGISPFKMKYQQMLCMPVGKPYMVWARFEQTNEFLEIANATCEALLPAGSYRKEPIPHATLGRFNHPKYAKQLDFCADIRNKKFIANEIILWESVRKSTGVVYEVVDTFALSG